MILSYHEHAPLPSGGRRAPSEEIVQEVVDGQEHAGDRPLERVRVRGRGRGRGRGRVRVRVRCRVRVRGRGSYRAEQGHGDAAVEGAHAPWTG